MPTDSPKNDEIQDANQMIILLQWSGRLEELAEIEHLTSQIDDKTSEKESAHCDRGARIKNLRSNTGKVFVPSMHCKGCRGSNRLPQSDFQILTKDKYYDADFELMLFSALFGFLLVLIITPRLARPIFDKIGK